MRPGRVLESIISVTTEEETAVPAVEACALEGISEARGEGAAFCKAAAKEADFGRVRVSGASFLALEEEEEEGVEEIPVVVETTGGEREEGAVLTDTGEEEVEEVAIGTEVPGVGTEGGASTTMDSEESKGGETDAGEEEYGHEETAWPFAPQEVQHPLKGHLSAMWPRRVQMRHCLGWPR